MLMNSVILTEKYKVYDFPEAKDSDVIFRQDNKAILWRNNQTCGRIKVGYVSINKRMVSLDIQKESVKYFMDFKKNFYILSNIQPETSKEIYFGLYSMNSKNKGDYFYFGFSYRFKSQDLAKYNDIIDIDNFIQMLKVMEKKIVTYK